MKMDLIEQLAAWPALLGWPTMNAPRPTIQKGFPLLSGQTVDLALWDCHNYWLVHALDRHAADSDIETAAFQGAAAKAALDAELLTLGVAEPIVVPVLFVARTINPALSSQAHAIGVFVRAIDLDGMATRP
jgi:hypothetical protein